MFIHMGEVAGELGVFEGEMYVKKQHSLLGNFVHCMYVVREYYTGT